MAGWHKCDDIGLHMTYLELRLEHLDIYGGFR